MEKTSDVESTIFGLQTVIDRNIRIRHLIDRAVVWHALQGLKDLLSLRSQVKAMKEAGDELLEIAIGDSSDGEDPNRLWNQEEIANWRKATEGVLLTQEKEGEK